MTAEEFLAAKSVKTRRALNAFLNARGDSPPTLLEAIRYTLFAGGKQFRPALALGAAELISGDDACALPAACAIEMLHCYSLVHDDLPAMDDDDLRRGKPTVHKAYGEALAILVGDALATLAFEMAAEANDVRVVREIAEAAGPRGMAGGQVLDLQAASNTVSLEQLRELHARKTGALIRASVRCGALLADANTKQLDALTAYGEHTGLAFQIADDILDVVGSKDRLGKPIGSDAAKAKSTYPAVVGLERARELANEATDAAIEALVLFGDAADPLRKLARFVVERDS
ncbi:MAG TPA: polyprenyl synthetase family protein [Candidatus Hydrogenedentes bacterium]|nr:polyprenyl synthetase family protein [Candidatus Hydrogenedentota bacterium]